MLELGRALAIEGGIIVPFASATYVVIAYFNKLGGQNDLPVYLGVLRT